MEKIITQPHPTSNKACSTNMHPDHFTFNDHSNSKVERNIVYTLMDTTMIVEHGLLNMKDIDVFTRKETFSDSTTASVALDNVSESASTSHGGSTSPRYATGVNSEPTGMNKIKEIGEPDGGKKFFVNDEIQKQKSPGKVDKLNEYSKIPLPFPWEGREISIPSPCSSHLETSALPRPSKATSLYSTKKSLVKSIKSRTVITPIYDTTGTSATASLSYTSSSNSLSSNNYLQLLDKDDNVKKKITNDDKNDEYEDEVSISCSIDSSMTPTQFQWQERSLSSISTSSSPSCERYPLSHSNSKKKRRVWKIGKRNESSKVKEQAQPITLLEEEEEESPSSIKQKTGIKPAKQYPKHRDRRQADLLLYPKDSKDLVKKDQKALRLQEFFMKLSHEDDFDEFIKLNRISFSGDMLLGRMLRERTRIQCKRDMLYNDLETYLKVHCLSTRTLGDNSSSAFSEKSEDRSVLFLI